VACKRRTAKFLLATYIAVTLVFTSIFALPAKAEASSTTEQLLLGAVAVAYLNHQVDNLDLHHQQDMYTQTQKQTGYLQDEATQARVQNVASRIKSTGLLQYNYKAYANPKDDWNAFCTIGQVLSVNKGMLEAVDDDELAMVMGHEMAHGERRHPATGFKKSLGLGLIVDLYLTKNENTTSLIVSNLAANIINSEVFTLGQEWEADNIGYQYMVAAGYNPGAGSAQMAKVRAKYGELWAEGPVRIIQPNNHPKMSDRVNNFAKKMTEYSGNHVTVKGDKTVQIDGMEIISPVQTKQYLSVERTYLVAGNLARAYHDGHVEMAYVNDDGDVYMGNIKIMSPVSDDLPAREIADRINAATGHII
jgi:predicted Zn-dependent protease